VIPGADLRKVDRFSGIDPALAKSWSAVSIPPEHDDFQQNHAFKLCLERDDFLWNQYRALSFA
jgi:hypothetical protein